jgi:hypothetical protein
MIREVMMAAPPRSPAPTRPNVLLRYFGILWSGEAWKGIVYLLLSFPLGLASFITLVTALSVSAGLAVTIVGAPLLVLCLFGWPLLAEFERWLSNALLATAIPPTRYTASRPWRWRDIRSRLSNPMTWKSLAFLFLRFPQGLVASVLLVTLLSVTIGLVVSAATVRDDLRIDVSTSGGFNIEFVVIEQGEVATPPPADSDSFTIDGREHGAWVSLVGLLLFPAALHFLNYYAEASGSIARRLLTPPPVAPAAVPPPPPQWHAPPWPAGILAHEPLPPASPAPVPIVVMPHSSEPPLALHDVEPVAALPAPPAGFTIDHDRHEIRLNGRVLDLTPKEFALLSTLNARPGRVFSREELLNQIWSDDLEVTERTIDTHIQRLRRKLGDHADAIVTVRSIGYRFDAVGPPPGS